MAAPQLIKTWTVSPNERKAYTTLAGVMGWFLYRQKVALLARGWTVKFSSDGTTGPASAADTTDRWTGEAAATTRGATAAAAQSWIVLQNNETVQLKFAFTGASDDIGTISYSAGGLFAPAGTATHAPTATDEVTITSGNSLINATTSLDRVMTIWTTSDTRHWSCAIFRNGAIVNIIGLERINSLCAALVFGPDGVLERPYLGYRYTNAQRDPNTAGSAGNFSINVAAGAATYLGGVARVWTNGASRTNRIGVIPFVPNNIPTGSGGWQNNMSNAVTCFSNTPALQGGIPIFTPPWFAGEEAANLDGFLGYGIDWWQCHSSSSVAFPAAGDVTPGYEPGDTPGVSALRTNWLIAVGSGFIRPWKNAAANIEFI